MGGQAILGLMDLAILRERARLFKAVRSFFDDRSYLEVDTPSLAPNLIPETALEVFQTAYLAPPGSRTREASVPYWLIPSPELWMKRLLADHRTSLYQICRSFRNGESTGRLHSPEFVMLEYYTVGVDYRQSLRITEDLFRQVLPSHIGQELKPPFLELSMDEAFRRWVGVSVDEAAAAHLAWLAGEGPSSGVRDQGAALFEERARKLSLDPPPGLPIDVLYNLLFVHSVEPALPKDRPVALMDYPSFVPCLAADRPDGLAKERWELYARGVELANCYSEETDPERVKEFFERESDEKARVALVPHLADGEYWKTFSPRRSSDGEMLPFPACSGVAMGMDRLLMIATGRSTIDSVLPFPMA